MACSNVLEASEEKSNGTKISRLLIDGGTYVSRIYFDSFHPPGTLPQILRREKKKLQKGKKSGLIRDVQWKKLFPSAGSPTSKTFDMTLLHFLIREIYLHQMDARSKWNTMPEESDQSALANLIRIRCFRNEISHSCSTGIPNDDFEDMWNDISSALVALGFDQTEIDRLYNEPIDPHTHERVKEANELWKLAQEINARLEVVERDVQQLREKLSNIQVSEPRTESEPDSYLPDEVTNVFGRDEQIKEVIEVIQSGREAAVVITGGPGFGKTTVAIKAAYKLVQEHGKSVMFCDLTSIKTLRDVETLMLLTCSSHTSPDNPQHWLFNWSKELKSSVTFVLDNADDVVDRDCEEFLKFLSGIRTFSRQKVTFITTSRREFGESIRQTRIVRLGHLPSEEAKQILWSRMTNPDSFKECLSKDEQLINLCGYVPLALCIAGSLLSKGVYTEDELVTQLETEPTAVLQCNRRPTKETSVEKSITISMEALDTYEKQALILLSSFPGSFNDEVAKFLIRKVCSTAEGDQASLILCELTDRSLLEKPSFQRYQVHSLIQAFSRKFSRENYPNLLTEGEKLACAHFISRIDNNAKQYWSKDTCKAAIDSFTEERHNFEHFLQVYIRGIQNQEHTTVEICETFFDDFLQKCMYLEKCLQPSFYIQILESLLTSPEPEIQQPVKRVELLCLLGHEMRKIGWKIGEKTKYADYMKKANQLFSEYEHEFKTQALSEVFYRQSYARYLLQRNETTGPDSAENGTGPDWEYKTALHICEEKYPDHPETAATLMFAGRYAKRRHDYDDVIDKYNRALDIFETQLGLHLMTAQCYKDIADFLFAYDKKESYLDVTLKCYQQAFGMIRELEMDDQKESILTLKNYGVCQINNGNFQKGEKLLLKAESVAERELEENHPWKVLVKTEQAVFYKKARRREEMAAALKEGLEMHYKIVGKRTLDELRNKHVIREVLNCYPELFPPEKYPRS